MTAFLTPSFNPIVGDKALLRLRIGVTRPDGTRAAQTFEREAHSEQLVPVISGAETNGDDSHDPTLDQDRPTDEELNVHYLEVNGWAVHPTDFIPRDPRDIVWTDPLSGSTYFTDGAMQLQQQRDQSGGSSFTD